MFIHIVRHAFKNKGVKYLPGDLIESPEDIKLYKCKISEGTIIALDRQSVDTVKTLEFLEQKLNVGILDRVKEYLSKVDKESEVADSEINEEPEAVDSEINEE